MKFRVSIVTAALASSLPLYAFAQTQQVKPPIAVYWMSVETAAAWEWRYRPAWAR